MGKFRNQIGWINCGPDWLKIDLPDPHQEVLAGVRWGYVEELFSPAFWKHQVELQSRQGRYQNHRLGNSLKEEVCACLLGGYGIPAELGMAAFKRVRDCGLIERTGSDLEFYDLLSAPFYIEGRKRKYRFAKQKAIYLAQAIRCLDAGNIPGEAKALRNHLMELRGIGPKTASWIVRNFMCSDEVAIIDIHLLRAGKLINLFEMGSNPSQEYFKLEERFLNFCEKIEVRASVLDALIWDFMRRVGLRNSSSRKYKLRPELVSA